MEGNYFHRALLCPYCYNIDYSGRIYDALVTDPHGERCGKYRTGPGRKFPAWPCIFLPYLPHLLTDDPTDGVCRVLLHLGCGMGVGVQGEASRVVAQRAGQRFHVHPAFQRQRGEGMPLRYNYDKPEKPRISRVFGYLARFFILFQTEKSSREVVIS